MGDTADDIEVQSGFYEDFMARRERVENTYVSIPICELSLNQVIKRMKQNAKNKEI